MKIVKLTKGYEAVVDDEDFLRVSQFKWHVAEIKRRDGSVRNVYARRSTGKYTNQLLHRFILGIDDPTIEVDHRDNYGLNCRRGNLRVATGSQNYGNSRRRLGTS